MRARTASRTLLGTASASLAITSVTKKGLPPVVRWSSSASRVDGGAGLAASASSGLAHAVQAERVQVDPAYTRSPAHVPEQEAQRMTADGLLGAVGHQHERAEPVHAPGQVSQQVEGRVVGPVGVLDDQEGRRCRAGPAPRTAA